MHACETQATQRSPLNINVWSYSGLPLTAPPPSRERARGCALVGHDYRTDVQAHMTKAHAGFQKVGLPRLHVRREACQDQMTIIR